MKFRLLIISLLIVSSVYHTYGQKAKGDKFFNVNLFGKAIKAYHRALASGDSTIFSELAESYRMHKEYEKAEIWYAKAITKPEAKPIDYFYYAEVLVANQKYEESIKQMRKYQKLSGGADTRSSRFLQDDHYFEKLLHDVGKYEVRNMKEINTSLADFGPSWYKDSTILITSTGVENVSTKKKQNWDQEISTDIYQLTKDSTGQLSKRTRLKGTINTKYYDGPAFWHHRPQGDSPRSAATVYHRPACPFAFRGIQLQV